MIIIPIKKKLIMIRELVIIIIMLTILVTAIIKTAPCQSWSLEVSA